MIIPYQEVIFQPYLSHLKYVLEIIHVFKVQAAEGAIADKHDVHLINNGHYRVITWLRKVYFTGRLR